MALLNRRRAGALLGATLVLMGGLSATPANAVSAYHYVWNEYNDKILEADTGLGNYNGMRVQVNEWGPQAKPSQRWRNYGQNTEITNEYNGKCLDADTSQGSRAGMKVQLWDCHGGANQKWHIWPDGEITSRYNGMCLDADTSGGNVLPMRVQLWPCHGGANQRWGRFETTPWDIS